MRNAHCYVTALLYLSFFLCCVFTHIYIGGSIGSPPTLSLAAPISPYSWRRHSSSICFSPNQICFSPGNGLRVRLPGKGGADAGDMRFFWRFGSEPEAAAQRSLFYSIFFRYWISGSIRPSVDWRWCQCFMGMYFSDILFHVLFVVNATWIFVGVLVFWRNFFATKYKRTAFPIVVFLWTL